MFTDSTILIRTASAYLVAHQGLIIPEYLHRFLDLLDELSDPQKSASYGRSVMRDRGIPLVLLVQLLYPVQVVLEI